MSRDVFGVLLLLKELELGQCSDQSSFHSAVVKVFLLRVSGDHNIVSSRGTSIKRLSTYYFARLMNIVRTAPSRVTMMS